MRVLNPGAGNPLIALTYTSFAEVTAPTDVAGHAATTTWYVPFGATTPGFQMPRTGSATYTGIVVGRGYDGVAGHEADLSGSSRLAVNFGTGANTVDMTLTSTDRTNAAARALGTFTYAGTVGGACPGGCGLPSFLATANASTYRGNLNGLFFGANAAEFGASFNLNIDGASSAQNSSFAGVAVGRKDP